MEFQVALLITIITTSAVLADQTDDLKNAFRKTKANFEMLGRALEGDLTSSQIRGLKENEKNIKKALKYFAMFPVENELEGLQQHLAAVEKKFSAKDTRGIVDTGVQLITGALQSAATIVTDSGWGETLKRVAAKSAKLGIDMLGAAGNVASTALGAMYPDEIPVGVMNHGGNANKFQEIQYVMKPENPMKDWKSPFAL